METAVLLCVPEAERLVHDWRLKGDPSASHGVPAHVTLLYPFLPVAKVDDGVLEELRWFFAGIDAFPLRFGSIGRFEHEGVVFLKPESDDLVQMAKALARRWPECPPYSGAVPIDQIVPHLTIVQSDDRQLRQAAANAVSPGLPLVARATTATLWASGGDGEWAERAAFPFGPAE